MNDKEYIKEQLGIINQQVNGGSIDHGKVTAAIQAIDERIDKVLVVADDPKAKSAGKAATAHA